MLISISANVEKFLGHFCAGDGLTFNQNGRNFTPDSCNGDSGGPLTYKQDNGQHVLIGDVSRGNGCAKVNENM